MGDRLVYDCIDPCLAYDCVDFDGLERRTCETSGAVFATAHALLERTIAWNERSALLPNACSDLGSVENRTRRRRPVAGYLGTIDRRVSLEHIKQAARRLPDFDFVIAGRVNQDRAYEASQIAAIDNVSFLGPVPHESGKDLLDSFDVGLIPFTENYIGNAINPVKMYCYLERGTAVVSTNIRECRAAAPHVLAVEGHEDFAGALVEAAGPASAECREDRRMFALENTWSIRAAAAIATLQSDGILR